MMNGVQTLFAGMTTQSMPNGLAQAGMEQTANGSAFAALVASLLGGDAMPAMAQETTLFGLLTGATLGTAETAEGATDEESLEAALEQLAAWIGSLSAEQQQKLAADPKVAEWMAMTDAELTMSGHPAAGLPMEAQEDGKPLSVLFARLLEVLKSNETQPFLAAAAKQAKEVITSAVESDIANLLTKTNGTVETEAQPKAETPNANVRWSHFTAMQAKTVLVRVTGAETNATTATAVDTAAKGGEPMAGETNGLLHSNAVEAAKAATQAEAAKGTEAAPRMPLAEATERLNEWVLKHSATSGSLKAETVLKLMPEHLGQVEVKLSIANGQLTAAITTESAMAKEALESNLATLRSSLQSQGVTIERLVVSQQQPSGFQSGMFQEGRQQRQPAERDGARGERGDKEQEAEDWAEALAVNAGADAVERGNYGSSFRAQA
ncbi:flagellar hook-length control protein FliK [Paenibacillus sp.]|uniref:flagellar hook-length control protein FliK n=1 Tax=Paenibacillus sp. TaxID=58172 RepID=UPI002810D71F|nr:flagellar hook-length control protein FliK [Paenibacillus sp.]